MTMPFEADPSAETAVLEALREGRVARFTNDEERTIRASFLRWLALTRLTDVSVAPLFIAIDNAIVDGDLQLSGIGSTTAPLPPLALTNCHISGEIDLSDSAWTSVSLDSSRIAGLTAPGLRVERSLILNCMTFVSAGPVSVDLRDMVVGANFEARNLGRAVDGHCRLSLDQAQIGGSVCLTGATLSALDDKWPALAMTGVVVKDDLLLNCSDKCRFEARGAVRLVNATIDGRVSFRGASIDNSGKESLVMDGTQVGGDLLFGEHSRWRFEANGAVCLRGIVVNNTIDFMGAKLLGRPDALLLSGAQIGANLILRNSDSNRFEASGAVGLPRATIGGEVRMQGANLSADEGELFALYMDETTVRGSAFLSSDGEHRFKAKGLVDLYGARFDMNLVLNGASVGGHLDDPSGHVVDRAYQEHRQRNDAKRIFEGMALDLRQVAVHGKVLLGIVGKHRFKACGLVCLNGARIGSELFLEGAKLYNPKGVTLSLDSAQVARDIYLTSTDELRFQSRGMISGWGCTVGGGLYCNGALLRRPDGRALRFDQATIRGQVYLWHHKNFQFVAKGAVLFRHSRIEGSFKCDGACFFGRSKVTLSLDDAIVTGGVVLRSTQQHHFASHGRVSLQRTQIGGHLDLTGAKLSNRKGVALNAVDASIGGDVELCSQGKVRFESWGELGLSRVEIKGRLICRGARLRGEQSKQGYRREERPRALSLYGGVVNDKVVMEGGGEYRFEAFGLVDLSHTKIGAGVTCTATRFVNPRGTALSLESAKVTGDVYLTDAVAEDPGRFKEFAALGDVNLQAVDISGDLTCDGCFRSKRQGIDEKDQGKALIFDNGNVRHRWYVRLKRDSVGEASLRGGRVGDLDDDGGNNWGDVPTEDVKPKKRDGLLKRIKIKLGLWWGGISAPCEKAENESQSKAALRGIKLKLDGFTYERFGPWKSPDKPTHWFDMSFWWVAKTLDLGVQQNLWVSRCEWLQRQYRGDNPKSQDFFPQPHEQAAKALFSMGHNYDARRLLNDRSAHQARCRADEWLSRLFMRLYRLGFGCGYLPNRALMTVAIWCGLGWAATAIALLQGNVLVKAATSVEIVRTLDKPDALLTSPRYILNWDHRNGDGTVEYRPYGRIDTRDIACSDADVSALLYALDTMLPVLDLHIEDKCEVSSDWPSWRILKAAYAMIGWIIVALAAFTWTGVFRRSLS